MRVTILGCGGSSGVPTIGNRWGACDPANPKNRRRRSSVLMAEGETAVVIDTAPEFREQLLTAEIARLDAVLYTHDHADHSHGIDDLREINRLMNRAVPVYGLPETLSGLKQRFPYCFKPLADNEPFYFRPVLEARPIADGAPFSIGGLTVTPFLQDHGYSATVGYRVGAFAYSTDVLRLDDAAFAALDGVAVWVVDCVREAPHPVHSHLSNTLEWIARVKPRRAYLTHMNNSLDYTALCQILPPGVEPAYDGLVIDVDVERDR